MLLSNQIPRFTKNRGSLQERLQENLPHSLSVLRRSESSKSQTLLVAQGTVWGIILLWSVLLECHCFLNPANCVFRSSTQLVRYSNFQNFHFLPYIHFLSLVKLEWCGILQHWWQHQGTSSQSFYQIHMWPDWSGVQTRRPQHSNFHCMVLSTWHVGQGGVYLSIRSVCLLSQCVK